jgi:hypothetical protein
MSLGGPSTGSAAGPANPENFGVGARPRHPACERAPGPAEGGAGHRPGVCSPGVPGGTRSGVLAATWRTTAPGDRTLFFGRWFPGFALRIRSRVLRRLRGTPVSVRYRTERHDQPHLRTALRCAAAKAGGPLARAAVAIAIAFSSFMPTTYRGPVRARRNRRGLTILAPQASESRWSWHWSAPWWRRCSFSPF